MSKVAPSPVNKTDTAVDVLGKDFTKGAVVVADKTECGTTFVSAEKLTAAIPANRPTGKVKLIVKNPEGLERFSEPVEVDFA